jgi:hypothetical protein
MRNKQVLDISFVVHFAEKLLLRRPSNEMKRSQQMLRSRGRQH